MKEHRLPRSHPTPTFIASVPRVEEELGANLRGLVGQEDNESGCGPHSLRVKASEVAVTHLPVQDRLKETFVRQNNCK